MTTPKRPPNGNLRARSAKITSGTDKTIKLHQSLGDRRKAKKLDRSARKAAYLSTLPKEPWKRILYRLHPKRVYHYWFSRDGLIMALKITGVGIVAMFLLIVGLFAYFRKDLPKINDINGDKLGGSNVYTDSTDKIVLWQDYDTIKRTPVTGDKIPDYVRNATIAIEDKDYYKHGAFDTRGLLRAVVHDATGAGGTQGGSTITQQLVKINQEWTAERSLSRKVKELILAVELEREYSKADILNAYLNIAPYGGVEAGVESASKDYFGISAKDLTLTESVMLAAIPKSPSTYSPFSSTRFNPAAGNSFDQDELKGRMDYILDQMKNQKMITSQQAADAKKVDVLALVKPLSPKYNDIKAPYFVLSAKNELEQKYGKDTINRGGWHIRTTLDMNLQTTAEKLVADNLPNVSRLTHGTADEEATVAEEVQTGQIKALVGGVDFNDPDHGQNNYASSVLIPPGSSFKPYDYAALIENNNNVGAGSVLYDNRTKLPGYDNTCDHNPYRKGAAPCADGTKPAAYDYDNNFPGAVTLRYALGGSRNVPAMKAMLSADPTDTSESRTKSINKTISTASAMMANQYLKGSAYNCYGDEELKQTNQCSTASAIGDGAFLHLDDHVNGLSTLARLGNAIPRTYILQITDSGNKTIYKWTQPKGKQIIRQDAAYIVNNMASDPNASYLPGSCNATTCTKLSSFGYKFQRDNGWDFAVKTGTTNNGYDGLMTSWSTKYAVVSWVGNHYRNVNIQQFGAQMETLTEPMTRGLMEAAHEGQSPVNWTKPSGVKTGPAYVLSHKISSNGEVVPSPSTDLFPSWYSGGSSKSNTTQVTDKVSGKTATSCTPDLAKNSETNGNAASWNADMFNGGKASTGSTTTSTPTNNATDDVHNCNDSQPTITLTAPSTCNSGSGCSFTVTASQGTHDLEGGDYTTDPAGTIVISVNGQAVKTFNMDQTDIYSGSFVYTPTASGDATVSATVVDSVLYSATSDTKTVSMVASTQLASVSATKGASAGGGKFNYTFTWSGGTAPFSVYQGTAPGGVIVCSSSSDNTCTGSMATNSKYYVQDGANTTVSDKTP